MPTELILIRHGQVQGTHAGRRLSGREDPPLGLDGRRAAERLAQRLAEEGGVEAIYVSPLRRARETAESLASRLNIEPQTIEALREWDQRRQMDSVDRLRVTLVTILSRVPPFRRLLRHEWSRSPALQSFVRSVAAAVHEIERSHPNGRIAIVAHGGTIDALLTHYFPRADQWERGVIRNCSLTRIEVGEGDPKLLAFDDCSHLP